MQTYTHLVVGAAVGSLLFPDNPAAIVCLVAGSTAPDLVMVPEFVIDKMAGRVPLSGEDGWLRKYFLTPSHSLVLWTLLALVGLASSFFVLVLAIGGVSHLLIDLCSHGDSEISKRDPPYFWPVSNKKLRIGSWEYRYAGGILWPVKPFEGVVIAVSIVVFFAQWWGRF